MSSPLATLKKGSARAVPFRAQPEFQLPNSDTISNDDRDKALLDEVVDTEYKKNRTHDITDFSLMQTMLNKIQLLEKQVQLQTKEIIDKDKIISKYEQQLSILQQANEIGDNKARTTELQAQCFILRKQVEQMEEFLADYGLIWVGESDEEDEDKEPKETEQKPYKPAVMPLSSRTSGYWSQDASTNVDNVKFVPNFDVLLRNIKELNILAGEGQSRIHTNSEKNEARLRPTETIPLALYINGLVLFDGPFRPYTDRQTRQFAVDILDGYFPTELQDRFPEGVPFKVLDRREVVYKDKLTEVFAGKGRRLKSADQSSNHRDAETSTGPTITSEEHLRLSGRTMTEDQFLSKLPKNIVKNSKIVDIRDGIASALQSNKNKETSSGAVQVIETKLVQELRDRMTMGDGKSSLPTGPKGRPGTPRAGGVLVTLRIRSEDGLQTFVLKVRPSETIGDIRSYINSHRKHASTNAYAIVQSFPKHVVFDDNKATLEQCGLMANAALFLRRNVTIDGKTSTAKETSA